MAEGGKPDQYWFCVKHHRVETVDNLCPSRHRLGPYETRDEAARALEIAEERNEAWDAADREDDDAGATGADED